MSRRNITDLVRRAAGFARLAAPSLSDTARWQTRVLTLAAAATSPDTDDSTRIRALLDLAATALVRVPEGSRETLTVSRLPEESRTLARPSRTAEATRRRLLHLTATLVTAPTTAACAATAAQAILAAWRAANPSSRLPFSPPPGPTRTRRPPERTPRPLPDGARQTLVWLATQPLPVRPAQVPGVTPTQAAGHLDTLRIRGLVENVGAWRAPAWQVTSKGLEALGGAQAA